MGSTGGGYLAKMAKNFLLFNFEVVNVTLFTLSAGLFFVCILVKYPTPPKKGRLEHGKKIPPAVSTTSKTSMKSCGDKSVTLLIILQKTALVLATPLSGNHPQSHHMTPNSKGEERHQRNWKNWKGASTSSTKSKTDPSSISVRRNLSSSKFPLEEGSKFLSNEL